MKIALTLNESVTPVWNLNAIGLPEEQIYLSVARPGPLELDTDTLTERELYNIMMALGKRQLSSPQAPEFMSEMTARRPSSRITAEDLAKRVAVRDESIQLPDGDLYSRAKALLAESVPTLKKQLTQIDNIRLLRIMKELEGSTKSRKSVLDVVDQKIAAFEQNLEGRRQAVEAASVRTPGRVDLPGGGCLPVELEFEDVGVAKIPFQTVRLEQGATEEVRV